jgi:L-asparaginase
MNMREDIEMTALPRIAVIGCGGTIATLADDPLDTIDYPEFGERVDVGTVLARVPETERFARIHAVPFRAVGSSAVGPAEWLELRETIDALPGEIDGVVVLHGTATIEETAYFLHLCLRSTRTVVLVGSQRPLNVVSSDAAMNLIGALRVAASPAARQRGVLVVLNDEIHCARDVVKTSNYRLQTFASPLYGPLGYVEGDEVHVKRASLRKHAPDTAFTGQHAPPLSPAALPRVDVVYSVAANDGALIDAACAAGAAGIVCAGLAPGLPTPGERAALLRARARGVQIVQSSRAHSGQIAAARRFLREHDLLGGDDLTPQKCRVLLMLGIAAGFDTDALSTLFATH